MTSLPERAFDDASSFPVLKQNILARTLLDEIESEQKWDTLYAE